MSSTIKISFHLTVLIFWVATRNANRNCGKISLISSDGSIVKTLHVGNLNKNVTEKDLIALFSLRTTKYLGNTCHVKFILFSKINNSSGFAYLTGPGHVYNELVKLIEIVFQGNILVIEEAKKSHRTFINTIKLNCSRCQPKIPKTKNFQ